MTLPLREDLDFEYEFPKETHGEGEGLLPYVSLRDAIGDLENEPGPYYTGSFSSMFMSRNRKKSWDEQSFTIHPAGRQAPIHPAGEPMHKLDKNLWEFQGDLNRRLSVKEIARIQTFLDWFTFSFGNMNTKEANGYLDKGYKQIGNAVPVLLAKAIAQPIADYVSKRVEQGDQSFKKELQIALF